MSRIVVSQFVTLDGVFEDPGGSEGMERGGWAFRYERGEEGDRFKLDEVMAADGLLLGRVTYEGFAAAAAVIGATLIRESAPTAHEEPVGELAAETC